MGHESPASRLPYAGGFVDHMVKMRSAPYLDVHVCDHCNLRCAGCLHFAPLAEKRFLDLDEYAHDLKRLASVRGIGGYFETIVLMGGEPLLHPRVAEIMRMTRAYLPGEGVALCTNGLLLRRMDEEFWDALVECDVELGISPYPIGLDYEGLLELARSKGANVRLTTDITGTARGKDAFLHPALDPDGACDPAQAFISCHSGGYCLQLARGAIWPCQLAAYHGAFSRCFGYDMQDGPDDSLPLQAIASADDIEAFRRRPHPMCRYCDNASLTVVPWVRSRLEADEWLAK